GEHQRSILGSRHLAHLAPLVAETLEVAFGDAGSLRHAVPCRFTSITKPAVLGLLQLFRPEPSLFQSCLDMVGTAKRISGTGNAFSAAAQRWRVGLIHRREPMSGLRAMERMMR